MNCSRTAAGFVISVIVGHIILWPAVEMGLWPYAARVHGFVYRRKSILSAAVGMVERFLYTTALIVGAWQWIGVWLAIKVAARWQRGGGRNQMRNDTPDSDNIWLIGTGLSLLFGYVGAWVAMGHVPIYNKPF